MSALHASALGSTSPETLAIHAFAVNAMTLAGLTALVYDHVLTFSDEFNFVWNARVGWVSVVFFLNRYLTPLVIGIDIYETFGLAPNSALFCKVWTIIQSYYTVVSFMSIHMIVAWRLYALHNGKTWVGRFLWTVATLYAMTSLAIVTAGLVPVISNLQPFHHECVGSIPSWLWITWLPSLVFESILFSLTVMAMLSQDRRHSFTTLSLILYRDGMLYFVVVTLCSLFSLLVWAFAGPSLLGLARYFALAAVNIAGSRLVLNLRSYAASRYKPESWPSPHPVAVSQANLRPEEHISPQIDRPGDRTEEQDRSFDVEMYSIERDFQQLGTKFMR